MKVKFCILEIRGNEKATTYGKIFLYVITSQY